MFDDLAAYFYENVVSSYREYCEIRSSGSAGSSQDIRKAMVAASALFHLREHLPPQSTLTRTEVESLCADYGILGDIVNASKHGTISGASPHGAPLIASASQLEELLVLTEYEDQAGKYFFAEKRVVAKQVNGIGRDVFEVLTKEQSGTDHH